MIQKTPIRDKDKKIDLIEHINQDHTSELLMIAQTFTDLTEINTVKLVDIYEEGADINVHFGNENPKEDIIFVPFDIKGDVEEKVLYLAYSAMIKQGKPLTSNRRRYFEVEHTQMVTDNILRLTLSSDTPLPEKAPAFAYGFLLKVLQKHPKNVNKVKSPTKNPFQRFLDGLFLWFMKKLSSQSRQKMLKSMNKGIRYYTLQKTWKSQSNNEFANKCFVDIFIHGNTLGSQWAKSLKKKTLFLAESNTKTNTTI